MLVFACNLPRFVQYCGIFSLAVPRPNAERPGSAGAPSVRVGRLQRYWLNDHIHVAVWFVVAATLLGVYLSAHFALRDRYLTSMPVEEAIAASVQLVRVSEDADTGRLELTVEGQLVVPGADSPGPLGLGRTAAARGLLSEAKSVLATYNRRLDSMLRDLLASFQPVQGRRGVLDAPLQRFAGHGFEAEPGQVVRIQVGALRPLVDIEPTADGARRVLQLLGGAQVHDLRVPAAATSAADEVDAPGAVAAPSDLRASLRSIQREVAARRIRLGSKLLSTPTPSALQAVVCGELAVLRAPVVGFFGEGVADVPGCPGVAVGSKRKVSSGSADTFHVRLASTLGSQLGFFWTLGPWLWLEVVLLCWLGVLTECLTRLGMRYSDVDPQRRRWEPRETGRTMLKLAYAPAIAIVVVWTFMTTDLIETDAVLAEGGMTAVVPIAFVLGLFPNLGFQLLERLARAIFRETSPARPRPQPARVVQKERGTAPTPEGAAPDFAAVCERVKRHITAPLRGT